MSALADLQVDFWRTDRLVGIFSLSLRSLLGLHVVRIEGIGLYSYRLLVGFVGH